MFCSSFKFEIPVRWCSSKQNSFPDSYYKINKSLMASFLSYASFYFSYSTKLFYIFIVSLLK